MEILRSIKWQIAIIIFLIFTMISAISLCIIYKYVNKSLIEALLDEGRIVAMNISELAAEKLIEDDIIGLKTNIEKYKFYLNIEYILIEDFNNQIKTDTYNGEIPEAVLKVSLTSSGSMEDYRVNPMIQYLDSMQLYDISQPIKEGLLGFVRIGLKKSYVDKKIKQTLIFLVLVFMIGTFLAITLTLFIITLQFSRPIAYLTGMAHRISMGDLSTRIKLKNRNEIGILGDAIERMRESLKTSIERLQGR